MQKQTHTRPLNSTHHLKGGVGVGQELLEVSLEPLSSLRSGLEGVLKTTVEIVALSGLVGGSVRLATGLNPDEGINELIAGLGSGADTESSVDDVAPVTLLDLGGGLDTVAA